VHVSLDRCNDDDPLPRDLIGGDVLLEYGTDLIHQVPDHDQVGYEQVPPVELLADCVRRLLDRIADRPPGVNPAATIFWAASLARSVSISTIAAFNDSNSSFSAWGALAWFILYSFSSRKGSPSPAVPS